MATYFKAPLLPVDGAESQPSIRSRLFKVGIAVTGASCLVLLGVVAVSTFSPTIQSAGEAESTSLFGMPTSLRAMPSSAQMIAKLPVANVPGASQWKDLALAGIQAVNRGDRDVSANANGVKAVLENMTPENKAMVSKATRVMAGKAEEVLGGVGVTAPLGFFDPLGISTKLTEGQILFYREAELKHGRISMLAALGFLVGEQFHPLFGGNIDVPSYIAFQDTPLQKFWIAVSLAIAIPEVLGSIPTFATPVDEGQYIDGLTFTIKTGRIPGDFGFDPLGLKPKDEKGFKELQNKELNNGRLAMFAIAGMVGQELVTGQKIF